MARYALLEAQPAEDTERDGESLLAVTALLRRGPLDKRVVRNAITHAALFPAPCASFGPILPGRLTAWETADATGYERSGRNTGALEGTQ
jgi:hypothetical protein